jgi:precorrin-6B methylase 2
MTMRRMSLTPLLALALTLLALTTAVAQSPATSSKPLDVPYVPTHEDIVAEMLSMARVGPNDVLYDLGSGDGRIVILAAKRYGARGVGVETDPQLVSSSRENAKRDGVDRLVTFVNADALTVDVSPATVVTLFLTREANLLLRPKLQSQLRRGARVVSHWHDMGDWPPSRTVRLRPGGGRERPVYLWFIPSSPAAPRVSPEAR